MRTSSKITNAHSMSNGIQFYSKSHKGCVAIATIDEQGNIKKEWTTIKEVEKREEPEPETKKIFRITLCIELFVVVFAILVTRMMSEGGIWFVHFFLLLIVLMPTALFAVGVYEMRKGDGDVLKFHAAEHMAVNAYRKLERVPTLEQIRQYSRFHNACGTNVITYISISYTLLFLCTFIPVPLYRGIGMLSVGIIVFLLMQCGFLNFLQYLTTRTPTDRELIVAIEGMKVLLENENKE